MKLISIIFSLFLIINLVFSTDPTIVSFRKPVEKVYPSEYCLPSFTILINYPDPIQYNYQLGLYDRSGGYGGSMPSAVNGTLYLFTLTHKVPIGKNQPVSLYIQDTSKNPWFTFDFNNYTTYDCDPLPPVTMKSKQNTWIKTSGQYSNLIWYHMVEVSGLDKSAPYDAFTCNVPKPFICMFQEFLNGPKPINFYFQVGIYTTDVNFAPFNVTVTDKLGKVLLNSLFDGLSAPANPPVSIRSLENYPINGSTVTKNEMVNDAMYIMNIINKNALCGISSPKDFLISNILIPVLGTPANASYIGFSSFNYQNSPIKSHVQIIDSQGTKRIGIDNVLFVNPKSYDNVIENVQNATYVKSSNINKTLINIKADVSFNPKATLTSSFSTSLYQTVLAYPYGYSNGTVKYHSVSLSSASPEYSTSSNSYIILGSPSEIGSGNSSLITVNPNSTIETKIPQLLKVETVFLSYEKVLTRVFAKDVDSGISFLYLSNLNKVSSADLVYGDNFNGVYESVETFTTMYGNERPTVSIYDNAGNNIQYNNMQPTFDTSFNMIPEYPAYTMIKNQANLDPYTFTGFEFKYNDVDVSNGPFNNTLCMNFAGSNKTMTPRFLQFSLALNPEKASLDNATPGSWDEVKGMFCMDFQIPARIFTGEYTYAVLIPPFVYDSYYFAISVGSKAQLRVNSGFADQMPPIITEFSSYPSNAVNVTQDTVVGWNIRIEDSPNGLASGEFNITSDFDLEPYRIKITPANAVSGDIFSSTYQLRIPIKANTCRSQSFRISSASITDTMGHTSVLPSSGNVNPLYKFLESPHLVLNITCPQAIIDNTPPSLISFSTVSSIEVGAYKDFRNVTFTFKTSDSGSGISSRHNPKIYLSSGEFDQISKISTLVSNVNGVATYTCTIELPYGYGSYNGILVSIYGIVDNKLNINGYSSVDLQQLGFQNTIKVLYSDVPVLDYTSSIKSTESSLTIYGHKFGIDRSKVTLQVDYMKGQGWKNTTISFFSGIILMTDNITPTSTPFYVRVIVDGKISNQLLVVPIIVGDSPCSYEVIQSIVATWIDSEKYPYLQASITIKNTGTRPIKAFSFIIEKIAYGQIWGVDANGNNRYTLPSYNLIINPRDQYSFGYIIQGTTVADLKQVTYTCL
ncbi:hypothetical protein DDB_G0270058 [Dictyostelium discoideum AX4]|uniref:Carbohydrate binding domain-containing protein n=1 Tax=Dictyostelium discoideum TaxID=44689 RepID=Q55CG8_DICDI|nr:hypothetical protein DDB_G0270058 [Dictyostelium discoideum AX4]EAL72379.1 hypothetical protein DDB_G0270058 [Dictyostelium discoideum AX4]|eukprot:XP_646513.1 hypothetical protein DDB_G0270058 [Dictyostelium discoideum AX4]